METYTTFAISELRLDITAHLEKHLDDFIAGEYNYLGPELVEEQKNYYRDQIKFFTDPDVSGNMSDEALEARWYAVINEANDQLPKVLVPRAGLEPTTFSFGS